MAASAAPRVVPHSATTPPPAALGPRLSPAGGVEVTGADLATPLTGALKTLILDAFIAHHIVVVRGQALTQEQQFDFTRNFGEIEDHVARHQDARYTIVHSVTNLDQGGNPSEMLKARGNYFWHTDKSYHAVPSLMTMLHAVELPTVGGDTQFANMILAYAALSDAMKRRIVGLRAVHSWEASRLKSGSTPATEEEKRERPPVDHPLVRTHPETGAKALYIGNHAAHIQGWPEADGRALLGELLEHATDPDFVYVHRWQPGDLIVWDNCCLLHRAVANYAMTSERRILHRTVVRGTVPL